MKIRNGFVSNSSSSSFLIRGIKIEEKKLAKLLEYKPEDYDEDYYDFDGILYEKKSKLVTKSTRDFFDGGKTGEVILGIELADPEDGVVVEISDDKELDEKLRDALNEIGIKDSKNMKFSTFFQYVSNDNY